MQVDWVLMKALSLGLIKGKIDEVDQSINVTWVQPKVLNLAQIQGMVEAVDEWGQRYLSLQISRLT
jgi:26S proteasome regulatory subunit N9